MVLVLRVRAGHRVLPGDPAEAGKLVTRVVLLARDQVREGPAGGPRLLAVHEDPSLVEAETGGGVEECGGRGPVRGAEPVEPGARRAHEAGAVPEPDVLDLVAAPQHLEIALADLPARDEGPRSAVVPGGARVRSQLVVHEQREGAVAVVESAQPVGYAHHAVELVAGMALLHGVPGGEDGDELHARRGRHDVGRLRAAGTGLGARESGGLEQGGAEKQRARCAAEAHEGPPTNHLVTPVRDEGKVGPGSGVRVTAAYRAGYEAR